MTMQSSLFSGAGAESRGFCRTDKQYSPEVHPLPKRFCLFIKLGNGSGSQDCRECGEGAEPAFFLSAHCAGF